METSSTQSFTQEVLSHNPILATITILSIGLIAIWFYAMTTSGRTVYHNKPAWSARKDTLFSLCIGIMMGVAFCDYFSITPLSATGSFFAGILTFKAMRKLRAYYENEKVSVFSAGKIETKIGIMMAKKETDPKEPEEKFSTQ